VSLAVRLQGISKRFGAVRALESVDLDVEAGTLHALVGENGAGKTTLMRVLYGAIQPDAGSIEVEGRARRFRNSREAIEAGIGMVSQHYSILPQLTCLQNLMLGAEPGAWIGERAAVARAEELAARMGFRFDWHADASTLSPAGAQKLEILKLLWRRARILILDEPTAMLSPADSDALFESLAQLRRDGATVILVTHRLPEVMDHAERVTVLRGGRRVASMPVAETDARGLAELIVGHALERASAEPPGNLGEELLCVRGLVVAGYRGDDAVRGADLAVRAGEIVGIAGVDGSGQRELFQAVLGVARAKGGAVRLFGEDASKWPPSRRLEAGLRLIPEDRHEEGVIDEWPLLENAALGLQRVPPLRRGGGLDPSVQREVAEKAARAFDTKHGGLRLPMASLSGGNQQRFVAGRALQIGPRLLLAFQPARGLDIEATRRVYEAIRGLCRSGGAAALVVSFDLDELLEHCDRLVAMRSGRIFEPPPERAKDRAEIGRLMVGAA